MSEPKYLIPDWPAPTSVKAAVSTRAGGLSSTPYDGFNLAMHVGDQPFAVDSNRERLCDALQIESVCWLNQIHGVKSVQIDANFDFSEAPEADASWTELKNVACAVLTADCLPILACNTEGTKVAAIHAGWRGLSNGVIARCLSAANLVVGETLIWFGPAIGPRAYQVGEEVREYFRQSPHFQKFDVDEAFIPDGDTHYLTDLYELAQMQLRSQGYKNIWGGGECTYSQKDRYFSYRRDGQTGRMASLIWIS